MTTEQERTITALQTAIQMEISGKEFYNRASHKSKNETGRKLLAKLAAEEEIHRKVFENIYEAIKDKHGWPKVDLLPDNQAELTNLFAEVSKISGQRLAETQSELEIIRTARQMEANTYDFYTQCSQNTSVPTEKELYQMIAQQEQGHNLALADYFEYLQDPAGWFVKKEHPHFD